MGAFDEPNAPFCSELYGDATGLMWFTTMLPKIARGRHVSLNFSDILIEQHQ